MLSSAQALREYELVIRWLETVATPAVHTQQLAAHVLQLQQAVYALKDGFFASPHTTWKKLLQQQVRQQQAPPLHAAWDDPTAGIYCSAQKMMLPELVLVLGVSHAGLFLVVAATG